jgi:hypothetical protein
MKTLINLMLTCFASGAALYEGFHLKNNIGCFMLAIFIWSLYFGAVNRNIRKAAARRAGEKLFEDDMRSKVQTRMRG